ncbi:glucanase B [Leptodontidium sp. MPI-SDFR-AT-0119]|nr:glucanase B [Leptodontidium sp. MPI-SDFR-AT-0119]
MVNTLNINLKNTTSGTVYAYVTGRSINNNNALCLMKANGREPYYPASPPTTQSPLALAAARIWFSINSPLIFLLNPGPGLVEPSVTNPSDPNINSLWGFCELTLNSQQLYANISYVDFVSIPISLSLTNASGKTQQVNGIPKDGLDTSSTGQVLRALSPNLGIVMNPSLFYGYFEPYVNLAGFGVVEGTVSGNLLNFSGLASYFKPSTRDIFSCSTGPFVTNTDATRGLTPRLAAALNRSTLLSSSFEPAAQAIHTANLDTRGYAFPYDDVAPSGGLDQSGSVFDPDPSLLTIVMWMEGRNIGWIANGDWGWVQQS